jgi:hypothetical protein
MLSDSNEQFSAACLSVSAHHLEEAEIHVALTIVTQASKELRDEELLDACIKMDEQNKRQPAWIMTQIQHRASHTLVVPQ